MTTITTEMAPTIEKLRDLLQAATDARRAWEHDEDGPEVPRIDELYDVTSLPLYGGDGPADTRGMYSWDPDRLLWADGNPGRDWYLAARGE